VAQLRERLLRSDPAPRFARSARALTADGVRLGAGITRLLEQRRAALNVLAAKLEGNSPEAILQRGYAIVTDEQGRPLRDAAGVEPGARITAQLARGRLSARVEAEGTDGGRQIGLF
jgi:exodeoxyribonuclease VII large subunit